MTLLDWEKALANIDHRCLGEALERMGIDQGIIETLEDVYSKASLFVEDEFGKSEKIATPKNQARLPTVLVMKFIEKDISG